MDANSELIDAFNRERSRDINICAAVGTEKSYTFTIFKEQALSSVSDEWKDKFQADGWEIEKTVTVPGLRLRDIYDQNFSNDCIDLLSIDAEGSDFSVLKSMEFESLEKARFPRFLLLEAAPPVKSALKTDSVEDRNRARLRASLCTAYVNLASKRLILGILSVLSPSRDNLDWDS